VKRGNAALMPDLHDYIDGKSTEVDEVEA